MDALPTLRGDLGSPGAGDGRRPRVGLVLGGAACVWRDTDAALALGCYDGVIACNAIGARWAGPLDLWATLHPENLPRWIAERRARGLPDGYRTACPPGDELDRSHAKRFGADLRISYRWAGMRKSGSSGLYAVKVALEQGYDRLVLAGVPMTTAPHFDDASPWRHAGDYAAAWLVALPRIKDRVRSLSGFTKALLGPPAPDWLAGR